MISKYFFKEKTFYDIFMNEYKMEKFKDKTVLFEIVDVVFYIDAFKKIFLPNTLILFFTTEDMKPDRRFPHVKYPVLLSIFLFSK